MGLHYILWQHDSLEIAVAHGGGGEWFELSGFRIEPLCSRYTEKKVLNYSSGHVPQLWLGSRRTILFRKKKKLLLENCSVHHMISSSQLLMLEHSVLLVEKPGERKKKTQETPYCHTNQILVLLQTAFRFTFLACYTHIYQEPILSKCRKCLFLLHTRRTGHFFDLHSLKYYLRLILWQCWGWNIFTYIL